VESFNGFLLSLDALLGSSLWFPYVLLGVGLFFTVYLGFPQLRFFNHAWRVLSGRYSKGSKAKGDTSHFQALSTALSGTVGTGNIGGVGLAIYVGGPAALFWMWMTAFLGMATKMVEVSLSHRYRVQTDNGSMAGGPMYYMERGLNMKHLAIVFAVATVICSFGTGNMPQINNIALSVESSFGVERVITGGVLAILLGLVIVGGISRIAKVTSTLVPSMVCVYFVGAMAVMIENAERILPSFLAIFMDAFTGSAAAGGFLGASFAYAFTRGVNRGLFSNEAGQGSAPIAHASAKTREPVAEGIVSLIEPFLDTIIICTITGLVILSSGVWTEKFQHEFQMADMTIVDGRLDDANPNDRETLFEFLVNGNNNGVATFSGSIRISNGEAIDRAAHTVLHARSVAEDVRYYSNAQPYTGLLEIDNGRIVTESVSVEGKSLIHSARLTTMAFTQGLFGDYGQYIVTVSLVLFAFSTAIAWSYYGDRAIIYLFGLRWVWLYRVIYCLVFFVAAFTDTTIVWNFAAVAIVLMALPNLFGIMMMRREMKFMVNEYWSKYGPEDVSDAIDADTENVS
jgi:alanine or glycine:cation symporter, AGCS family